MNDKDKWSAHLEYLKVAITLSTAILAVAAAIYSDPTKIPAGTASYMLLLAAIFVFLTLVASILAIIFLCNYLIRATGAGRPARITAASGISFFGLVAAGFFILLFFFVRTFTGGPMISALQATETVSSVLKGRVTPNESVVLDSIKHDGNEYVLDYSVMPSNAKYQASVSATDGHVEWIKRQP